MAKCYYCGREEPDRYEKWKIVQQKEAFRAWREHRGSSARLDISIGTVGVLMLLVGLSARQSGNINHAVLVLLGMLFLVVIWAILTCLRNNRARKSFEFKNPEAAKVVFG